MTSPHSQLFLRILSRVRLKHLQLVVDTAELRSLKKAAVAIGLSQPAATHALAEFESALGGAVFERHARGMRLSPLGSSLLPLLKNALHLMQACADVAVFLHGGSSGVVRIGATSTAISGLLAPALPAFSAANPDVVVEVIECAVDELPELIESNRVDFIVCRQASTLPEGFTFTPVIADSNVVVSGPSHPLLSRRSASDAELLKYRWLITPLTGISPRAFEDLRHRLGSPPRTCNVSSRSVLLARAMLQSDELLALIPYALVRPFVEDGSLALIATPPVEMPPMGLLTPDEPKASDAVSRVIDSLKSMRNV